jgi:5'(3')-deoxyribonucleotidase
MRIGIDMDGVLADFVTSHIQAIKKITGKELPPLSDTYPDVWDYDKAAGVTSEERNQVWEYIKASGFQAKLLPLPGAVEAIERLNAAAYGGHHVYFITSRTGSLAKMHSEQWLRWHGMDNPTVLIAHNKGPVALGLELEVFIDDRPENNEDVINTLTGRNTSQPGAERALTCRVYLPDQPWNRWATQAYNYGQRVKNINEALDIELIPNKRGMAA